MLARKDVIVAVIEENLQESFRHIIWHHLEGAD